MFRPLVVVAPLLGLAAVGAAFSQESSGESAPPPASHAFRSIAQYQIPDVRLVRDDGKAVSLPEEMNDGRPVVLNFIYTTCSTICPLMSQTLAQFDRELGVRGHLVDRHRVSSFAPGTPELLVTVEKASEAADSEHSRAEGLAACLSESRP